MTAPVLLWFRQDLRLADQPALLAALGEGPVIPVYVLDDETPGDWRTGGAQRWWLHHSLTSLAHALEGRGSRLILRRGPAGPVMRDLLAETGATRIHALRHYEPWWIAAEQPLGDALVLHDGNHLTPVHAMRNAAGGPFRAYAGFWRALEARLPPNPPQPAPDTIPAPDAWPDSDTLGDWRLLPTKPDWSAGFGADWQPGEAAGQAKLAGLAALVDAYETTRNLPAQAGTARLSPHLHFGEVSPAAVAHAAMGRADSTKFLRELAWRDHTANLVLQHPDYGDRPIRQRFEAMAFRTGKQADRDLRAWQRGRTGYPIVDAGMRQLWTTGWMTNRVRLITASYLVKHLLIDWRAGEHWFWDTLVDADYGNNAVNWQWIAGSSVESQLWSRIMAPLVQSEKFDAGDYIRRWVPELAGVPDPAIHDPDAHGLRPADYPARIVDHREARARALAAGRALPPP
jgi:deoxyribodipyrimidine photo-lyase